MAPNISQEWNISLQQQYVAVCNRTLSQTKDRFAVDQSWKMINTSTEYLTRSRQLASASQVPKGVVLVVFGTIYIYVCVCVLDLV